MYTAFITEFPQVGKDWVAGVPHALFIWVASLFCLYDLTISGSFAPELSYTLLTAHGLYDLAGD